jgi:hypothetical protein
MNRIRLLVSVSVLAALASLLALGASAAGSSSPGFSITHFDVPLFVKQNGPKGTRSIAWQGNPTFPVTVHERGICPESVNCGPRTPDGFGKVGTTAFATQANPLVTHGWYFCSGGLTSNYVLGIEVWLTDAKGHRTPIARNFWVCKTH